MINLNANLIGSVVRGGGAAIPEDALETDAPESDILVTDDDDTLLMDDE